MIIKKEISAYDFLMNKSWNVDDDFKNFIRSDIGQEAFDLYINELFSGEVYETDLNDFLRFQYEDVLEFFNYKLDDSGEIVRL